MKLLRVTLVCSLLLLAATPSFAIPCSFCNFELIPPQCEDSPGSGTRCLPVIDGCETRSAPFCNPGPNQAQATMFADWSVVSIEVSRPADGTNVVTCPADVAQAETFEATELK